jgi:hypothetical protein
VSRQAVDPQAFDLAARLAARLPLEELRVVVERVEAGEGVMPPASRRPSPRGLGGLSDRRRGPGRRRGTAHHPGSGDPTSGRATAAEASRQRRRRIVTTPALAGDGGGLMSPDGQAERTRA